MNQPTTLRTQRAAGALTPCAAPPPPLAASPVQAGNEDSVDKYADSCGLMW